MSSFSFSFADSDDPLRLRLLDPPTVNDDGQRQFDSSELDLESESEMESEMEEFPSFHIPPGTGPDSVARPVAVPFTLAANDTSLTERSMTNLDGETNTQPNTQSSSWTTGMGNAMSRCFSSRGLSNGRVHPPLPYPLPAKMTPEWISPPLPYYAGATHLNSHSPLFAAFTWTSSRQFSTHNHTHTLTHAHTNIHSSMANRIRSVTRARACIRQVHQLPHQLHKAYTGWHHHVVHAGKLQQFLPSSRYSQFVSMASCHH